MNFKDIINWLYETEGKLTILANDLKNQEINNGSNNLESTNKYNQAMKGLDIIDVILKKFNEVDVTEEGYIYKIMDILSDGFSKMNKLDENIIPLDLKETYNHIDSMLEDEAPLLDILGKMTADEAKKLLKLPENFSEHLQLFSDKISLEREYFTDGRMFNNIYTPKYLSSFLKLVSAAIDRIAKNPETFAIEINYLTDIISKQIYIDLFENNELKKEISDLFKNKNLSYTNEELITYLVRADSLFLNMIIFDNLYKNPNYYKKIKVDSNQGMMSINEDATIKEVLALPLGKQALKINNISSARMLFNVNKIPFGNHKGESISNHKINIQNNFYKILIQGKYIKNNGEIDNNKVTRLIDDLVDKYGFANNEIRPLFMNLPNPPDISLLFTKKGEIKHRDSEIKDMAPYQEAIVNIRDFVNKYPKDNVTGINEIRDILKYYEDNPEKNDYHLWLSIKNVAQKRLTNQGFISLLTRSDDIQKFYEDIVNVNVKAHEKPHILKENSIDIPMEEIRKPGDIQLDEASRTSVFQKTKNFILGLFNKSGSRPQQKINRSNQVATHHFDTSTTMVNKALYHDTNQDEIEILLKKTNSDIKEIDEKIDDIRKSKVAPKDAITQIQNYLKSEQTRIVTLVESDTSIKQGAEDPTLPTLDKIDKALDVVEEIKKHPNRPN